MGYDTNKKAFRYVLFGSNGRIDENIGQWNEVERVFDWKGVNLPQDLTRTSTTRRLDEDQLESHIVTKTLDLGGTITGEHGIGLVKKRWLRQQFDDGSFALMQQLKRTLDPGNILNPGKIFN